ncbi:MAG: hypothetical protein HYU64_04680 [Armatimonadetes bacterium]|nr:hypothetical protein [Armatimonadota bacterium]
MELPAGNSFHGQIAGRFDRRPSSDPANPKSQTQRVERGPINPEPLHQWGSSYDPSAGPDSLIYKTRQFLAPGVRLDSKDPVAQGVLKGDFLPWRHQDVKALDPSDDEYKLYDGEDSSRDLVALYSHEGNTEDPYSFRVDLQDLHLGAEEGKMDLYLLLSFPGGTTSNSALPNGLPGGTDHPWQVAVAIYDSKNHAVTNSKGEEQEKALLASGFNASVDAVQLALDKKVLRDMGWKDGDPLHIQAFTTKDFSETITDTLSQNRKADGTLEMFTSPWDVGGTIFGGTDTTSNAGKGKVAFVWHGNQPLMRSESTKNLLESPDGTGMSRILDSVEKWKQPVELHLSGTLQSNIEWANPAFNDRIKRLVKEGLVTIEGGVYAEQLMPPFVGEVNAESLQMGKKRALEYGQKEIPVAWTPERVTNAGTMSDMRNAGYEATIADYLRAWFPNDVGKEYKIHEVNGTKVFFIDHYLQEHMASNTDGGLDAPLRDSLLNSALSEDQEQVHLGMNDWEFGAGHPFGSSQPAPHIPKAIDRNLRWIAHHPWIETVTPTEILRQKWQTVQHGEGRYLTTKSYLGADTMDTWYYGDSRHESYFDYVPLERGWDFGGKKDEIASGKKLGGVNTKGTILADAWDAIKKAPKNALSDLARKVFMSCISETAWHDWDGNPRRISGWQKDMAGQVRQIPILTAAAEWAEKARLGKVSQKTVVAEQDLNMDGDSEFVISNNRIFAVFSSIGGRLVMAASYDTTDGAVSLVGSPLSFSMNEGEAEVNPQVARRNYDMAYQKVSGFREKGHDDEIYIRDEAPQGSLLAFRSPDSRVRKAISLPDGGNILWVSYEVPGAQEVLFGLSPNPNDMLVNGRENLSIRVSPNTYKVKNIAGGQVSVLFGDTRLASSDTNLPSTEKVVVEGKGSFKVGLQLGRD